ncbi:signal peptidase I Serine peptidase. MEROPS family S26A [Geoalkalibacter ferrihydriticus]|uniref:Signal peptidase I n=2 Tax=Geoalkalibacter ferrihydriticus TaxID=392333 RepID=A0A0C2DVG5_9BACT|nr:signal peptidase I [Geoalkalibacter ferrihydriticus]KIH77429.1 signal peptidase I [Geoalkalibacter ferrihydriticus DSM 17813]SDM15297.1 signal peptidase I Serine peptidase. MEROPS family S26A [Geoalkalibacter ferrihydriticus]
MFKSKTRGHSEQSIAAVKRPWYREYGEALIVALILALIIRTFVIQAFKIPSGSMEDTLLVGDHLLVNKFIYGTNIPFTDISFLALRDPARGDIVVFEFPGDRDKPYFQRKDFIKRIVGLPGDVIEVRSKTLYVNGEPYRIPEEVHKDPVTLAPNSNGRDHFGPITVPESHYFTMGDNRDYSYDSRFWGFVPEESIKGLAFIKYWSWDAEKNSPRFNRIARPIR